MFYTWSSQGISMSTRVLELIEAQGIGSDLLCHKSSRELRIPNYESCDISHRRYSCNRTNGLVSPLKILWDRVNSKDETIPRINYIPKSLLCVQNYRIGNTSPQRLRKGRQSSLWLGWSTSMSHVHRMFASRSSKLTTWTSVIITAHQYHFAKCWIFDLVITYFTDFIAKFPNSVKEVFCSLHA